MQNYKNVIPLCIACAAILSACGGGGGNTTPSVDTQVAPSFALQAGYKSLIAGGSVQNATISGSCAGTATISRSAPAASTFEGAAALAVTDTTTFNFTNCTPASNAATSTSYFDSNYNPLGDSLVGIEYGVFAPVPSPLPLSVKVGNTASFGTLNLYTDSTKRTAKGQRTTSFVIEADGSSTTTAVANLIAKEFNTANQLLYTQQSRYRIAADGKLTFMSTDIQYSTTSTNHLVLTAN